MLCTCVVDWVFVEELEEPIVFVTKGADVTEYAVGVTEGELVMLVNVLRVKVVALLLVERPVLAGGFAEGV